MGIYMDLVHKTGGGRGMRRGKWKANGGEIGKKRMGVDLIKNYMSDDKCFILFLIKVQSVIFLNKIFNNR